MGSVVFLPKIKPLTQSFPGAQVTGNVGISPMTKKPDISMVANPSDALNIFEYASKGAPVIDHKAIEELRRQDEGKPTRIRPKPSPEQIAREAKSLMSLDLD